MAISVRHIVLLGVSIFDNAAYVPGGPHVVRRLCERLPNGWRATFEPLVRGGAKNRGGRRRSNRRT
jgi:hypothetical protein